jgi:isoleucyl-tRNA synthetase
MMVDEKGIKDAVRSALLPLWNAWYFFALYANADGRQASIGRTSAGGTLDRYVLAKLHEVAEAVTAAMDQYDLPGACAALESFLDALTNWYIRRSRDRFWGTGEADPADTQDAFDTLGTVLEVLCRLAAPLMPMVSESVWKGLTGDAGSVHLADWPDAASLPADEGLVSDMDLVREVCSAAHSVRKANGLRARLPLARLTVAGPEAKRLAPFVDLIADEVNVRSVELTADANEYASRSLSVIFKVAAPRLGPATQKVAAAARNGEWELLDGGGRVRVGSEVLEAGEFELRVVPLDSSTTRAAAGGSLVVVLDTAVTDDLALEGRARDLVREVQQLRRQIGLAVTDRISLELAGGPQLAELVERHGTWIGEQVLAHSVTIAEASGGDWHRAELADGTPVSVRIGRL